MTVAMEYWLVVRWLAVYLFLFAAGLPLAAVLCSRLANRGAGIALPVSLAVLGLTGYWIGHLSFGWLSIGVGLLVLCGLIGFVVRSPRVTADIERRPAIESAVVFTFAFLFLVAVRAVDPAVHPSGGEKFLDYGLLRSLLRASALPPEDIWFAGEPVKYYYGGHMLSALLSELTATKARYAYNLALAGFYAMLVTATYGLAGSLGDSIGTARSTAGALGVFFVGFASNLQTPFRALLWVLPDETARAVGDVVGATVDGLAVSLAEFSYWNASRIIPGQPGDPDSYKIATEFPLFSWLNGDLHAHMMSTPFLLLVATLCFSYYRTPEDEYTRRRLLLGVCAVISGLIAVINTWSFPTVFGLLWLTLSFSPTDPMSLLPDRLTNGDPRLFDSVSILQPWSTRELRRTVGSLVLVGALVPVGIVVSLPFWLSAASGREVALVSERSSVLSLLLVHGGFLLVFVPYLFGKARSALDQATIATAVVSIGLLGAIAAWFQFRIAVLVLIVPIVIGMWVLLRRNGSDGAGEQHTIGYPSVLVLAGAGLVFLVEFIYLREQAGPGRYNTVFKTYIQVWVLWSPPAGAAIARIVRPVQVRSSFTRAERALSIPLGGFGVDRSTGTGTDTDTDSKTAGVGFRRLFVVLLLFSTAIYGSLALTNHFTGNVSYASPDDPTLDALAYIEDDHPDEATAIHWLDRRSGTPVVAAAPGTDSYQWTNPESSLTGLPTIAGWNHEIGYRNASVYYDRVDDVDTLYQGPPNRTVEMLQRYNVRYIYVGPNEREQYDQFPFDRIAGLEKQRFGDVLIYEVHQQKLTHSSNTTA